MEKVAKLKANPKLYNHKNLLLEEKELSEK